MILDAMQIASLITLITKMITLGVLSLEQSIPMKYSVKVAFYWA